MDTSAKTNGGLQKQEHLVKLGILTTAAILSFSTRLFSVLRFESVIHEFDPYFNYRTTRFLTEEGFYNFHNWFDDRAWYPLGRIIGGTIYPGLMITSGVLYRLMWLVNITIDIRNFCVFLAPFFSSLTTIVTYLLTKEIHSVGAGLVAAAMISIVPGYISRSVAGSYDNEGIAIFCMLLTYYFWIKAVKTGAILWSTMSALAYFYMVSSWGGYVFLINLIPLHVLALMATGRFSHRIYVAYSILYCVGTILSMQISFVGFQPVQSSEHMLALGVFGLCQIHSFVDYIRSKMSKEYFDVLFKALVTTVLSTAALVGIILTITGKVSPWTGRFYSLLDPSYAKNHIPIIASVSEHQPASWSSFYFDLQILVFLFPAGLYFCFSKLSDANIFIILYGITSIYFAGVMVRLMLVLAPVMCILSGITVSHLLTKYIKSVESQSAEKKVDPKKLRKFEQQSGGVKSEVAVAFVGVLTFLLISYTFHCTWVTSEAYSSPSIVLSARSHDGGRIIFDDFREAYYWLKMNTPEDARIMSWWDYGYQITAMANRTILFDNNTWNNTHISRVGQAMASTEEKAYEIMRELDVDYVLVIFGGLTGYSSDGTAIASADHWGYPAEQENGVVKGDENWGGQCALGRRQSPIDLAEDASVVGVYPSLSFINYSLPIQNAKVKNTGHSIQIDITDGQEYLMTGGGLPGTYVMDQMHFHWASEHTLNSERYGLELHIVSHEKRFGTFAEAVQNKNGVAVLGILFHVSDIHNINLKNILDSAEPIKNGVGLASLIKAPITPAEFLPNNRNSFFRYEGSLTTPTCDEAVMWTILTESVPFAMLQIERFKETTNEEGAQLTNNFRQLQRLNSRPLVYVKQSYGDSAASMTTISMSLLVIMQAIRKVL